MPKIAVLGANGQLGQSLQYQLRQHTGPEVWDFYTSALLDITKKSAISKLFTQTSKYDYILNFAAYTQVDQAEKEKEIATKVNATALEYIAKSCQETHTVLIHMSTDYVFDGKATHPYQEDDATLPINHYGQTKLEGEKYIQENLENYFILRTGWLYSNLGHNFYRTMKKLAQTHEEIRVVSDQFGTPTHTHTVVQAILKILALRTTKFGVYHIGNQGEASWYDFAKNILEAVSYPGKLRPIPSKAYPTPAERPAYSVLDKGKFENTFDHRFPSWEKELAQLTRSSFP